MDATIPEGFTAFDIPDDFIGLVGPLYVRIEADGMRIGLPLERRHGNPMGVAHGGLLVTVADMVMGIGCGFTTGIRWPHPTISMNCDFVRGAKLGNWVDGKAVVTRRTANFCFCRTELVCAGETVLTASGVFRVPDLKRVPPDRRPPA
ncbi:MAG: PaaI family thioesterase [Rhodospirillales bacterium]|nr:MAG: PaaI family thioesterase [Rhodospirillales bacterium]